jgi:hypothetical protein
MEIGVQSLEWKASAAIEMLKTTYTNTLTVVNTLCYIFRQTSQSSQQQTMSTMIRVY